MAAEHGGVAVAIFVLALAMSVLVRSFLSQWLRIPFTVSLFCGGMCVGAIHASLQHQYPLFDQAVDVWANLPPSVFLFVLLPPLIFESAVNIPTHLFVRQLPQILFLAVPGMLLGCLLTALVPLFFASSSAGGGQSGGWDWSSALLFGGMLAATDPVAAVAVMRDAGVDTRLSVLVEGESLLNDGTGIVVFQILVAVIKARGGGGSGEIDIGELVAHGVQLALVAPALGFVVALVVTALLGRVFADHMTETSLTIIACFATFAIAEGTPVHTSGVLATCFTGLFMGHFARGHISAQSEEATHSFWEVTAFIANTLVFFVAGIIVSDKAFFGSHITTAEWIVLLVLFLWINLVRAIVIVGSLPIMRASPYPFNWRHLSVLSHCGLRGAVGLILALTVQDIHELPERVRDQFLFYMAGTAVLTLVINATSTGPLLSALKLDATSATEQKIFEHACDFLEAHVARLVRSLQTDRYIGDADWPTVWRYVPVFSARSFHHRFENHLMRDIASDDAGDAAATTATGQLSAVPLPAALRRYWSDQEAAFRAILVGPVGDLELNASREHSAHGSDAPGMASMRRTLSGANVLAGIELSDAHDEGDAHSVELPVLGAQSDRAAGLPFSDSEMVKQARVRFLLAVRSGYAQLFRRGWIKPQSLRFLEASIACETDFAGARPLSSWESLVASMGLMETSAWQRALSWRSTPIVGALAESFVAEQMSAAFDLATGFIMSHEQVPAHQLLGRSDVAKQLDGERNAEIARARALLRAILPAFPDIARALKTRSAAHFVLVKQREAIDELFEDGLISAKERERFAAVNTSMLEAVHKHPAREEIPAIVDSLLTAQRLRGVPRTELEAMAPACTELIRSSRTILLSPNDSAQSAADCSLLFCRGSARATRPGEEDSSAMRPLDFVGEGDFMNLDAALSGAGDPALVVESLTFVHAIVIHVPTAVQLAVAAGALHLLLALFPIEEPGMLASFIYAPPSQQRQQADAASPAAAVAPATRAVATDRVRSVAARTQADLGASGGGLLLVLRGCVSGGPHAPQVRAPARIVWHSRSVMLEEDSLVAFSPSDVAGTDGSLVVVAATSL